ncbi:MIF4G like-domain-containing protein [Elsinoe ampelina]|uniref:MIF4G like-domain-containing protein n=1 Tax=Elsinoe ampelina TaxID=302913 RepID=A0A6A6G015_9PEZI|nr:MIF4G like-domain-containing protein [Elsinoe ampelina]
MGDTDRQYHGGGRPYHGGGGNRKRRFNDDDAPSRPPQRRRFDPPGTRLRKKLLTLADAAFVAPETEISEIVSIVVQNSGDDFVRDTFCDLALSLVVEQPCKVLHVAAAVRGVNAKRPEVVADLVERAGVVVERAIRRGDWKGVKLGLRFLGAIGGVVEEGVVAVLEDLFNKAVDLQSTNPEETLGPELVKVILLTIPYLMVGDEAQGLAGKMDEMLEKTEVVASTPHNLETLVDPYPSKDGEPKVMPCPNVMSILQKQLQEEAANGWPLACLPRINMETVLAGANGTSNGNSNGDANGNGDANVDAAMAEEPTRHPFPTINIPDIVIPGKKALYPELYYSVFADQEVESVPPTSNIASVLIRDAVVDTVNALDFNRNHVGKFIIDLDNYWARDTFVKRSTPFDKLKEIPQGRSTWKPEDVAVDAIFSQLMLLPNVAHKQVFYHGIVTEACKLAPSAIAPSLGRAIRFTFRTLPELDLELVYRFTDWFAHHVSNFEFRWKWTEWLPELSSSLLHPRRAFITAAIDKEIRLSFPKRIADSLPPDFASTIAKGQYNDQPDFKFTDPSVPYSKQGTKLLTVLKDKSAGDAEIAAILDEVSALAAEQGADGLITSTDVLITSICHIGSKSLSHILSSIQKNQERLLAIGPQSDAARRQIISSVATYWTYQPGQAVNIIDKLLNYTIVTPQSVVEWALQDNLDAGKGLARHSIFEMVWGTMGKVARRVGDIAAARANPELLAQEGVESHVTVIQDTLVRERGVMMDLFTMIEDAARGVSQGAGSGMQEDGVSDGDEALLRLWGEKWLRLWGRKKVVEEARSGEAGVEGLITVLREVGEVEKEIRADEEEEKRKREEGRAKRDDERRKRFEEREAERDDGRGRVEMRGGGDGEDEVL